MFSSSAAAWQLIQEKKRFQQTLFVPAWKAKFSAKWIEVWCHTLNFFVGVRDPGWAPSPSSKASTDGQDHYQIYVGSTVLK